MASREEVTLPATRPRSRKSLAHLPSADSMYKENVTGDIGRLLGSAKDSTLMDRTTKKSRSKSIGPGDLGALKESAGNRRKSINTAPPKSILKATIPSLQEIPPRNSVHRPGPNTGPTTPSIQSSQTDRNVDTEVRPASVEGAKITGSENLPNPFSTGDATLTETRVMLRSEDEQEAAAREREAREGQEANKDLAARRDARRKSLANRRVSFAPEATLHTWDVVEYMQDSTTSSASTNSTRRASSASSVMRSPGPQSPGHPPSDTSEPPSTPPEQIEEDPAMVSPAHQRDLHQKKRRRSSGIPPLNFNNPDDDMYSSSPSDGSSIEEEDSTGPMSNERNGSDSNSDDDEEDTPMSFDVGDATDMSMASVQSGGSSTGSSARLEAALQLAARQAGTQGIDFDENGLPVEDEVAATFSPWSKSSAVQNLSSMQDQENLNPFSPAFKASVSGKPAPHDDDEDEDEGLTMDITQAVGGILQPEEPDQQTTMEMTRGMGRIMPSQEPDDEMTMEMTVAVGGIMSAQQDFLVGARRESSHNGSSPSKRSRLSDVTSSLDDRTMDLTMAIGGIQQSGKRTARNKNDEDMTMEFSSVSHGGLASTTVSPSRKRQSVGHSRLKTNHNRDSIGSTMDEVQMDMTTAIGRIVSAQPPQKLDDVANVDDQIATALGEILPEQLSLSSRPEAKRIMEEEVDHSELASSPFQTEVFNDLQPIQAKTMASETGSPGLAAFKGRGLRRSTGLRQSTTPRSIKKLNGTMSPVRDPSTPPKQLTPKLSRPATPGKTPPSKNETMRLASPKTLFESENGRTTTPRNNQVVTPKKIFKTDNTTGATTPNIILNHRSRRSSGLGVDRIGLGSPRVANLLDRRVSIGDSAAEFIPRPRDGSCRGVVFGDPKAIELEIDRAREEDKDREDERKIMEREADIVVDEKDATLNLKEMIESLTPKKRPLKGRKSLHIGAAKGLLGKRPAELDEDDEEDIDDQGGVKRLKNHQGSPVKNVKLHAPPSKSETTGRLTRSARRSLDVRDGNIVTPTAGSSPAKPRISTPKDQGRFKDVDSFTDSQIPVYFDERTSIEEPLDDRAESDDRIQLQDFLNMTSIRFMELTTTKRRHTAAPNHALQVTADEAGNRHDSSGVSLESCVVAGACTVPMLELFQHSCRELKNYISEGRSIVREIESETFEENPPLFREYMSASRDMKLLMDNQFKNVKTHSRLLSKAMWYEWRMKLLDGLKDGLFKIRDGLADDSNILEKQQILLDTKLPNLLEEQHRLANEEAILQAAEEEIASCDQAELEDARQRLIKADEGIHAKRQMVLELQAQLVENESLLSNANETKQQSLNEIREAEAIREECRGWTGNEVAALKAKVDSLERVYGWTVTGVSGTVTSLSFRGELELVFDASSFQAAGHIASASLQNDSRLDLWYIAGNRERNPIPITPEKTFLLENIRDGIRSLPQALTTVRQLLHAVSSGWEKSRLIARDIESLGLNCPIEVTKTSDASMAVRAMLLLVPLSSKVELRFDVEAHITGDGLELQIEPKARVIYGEKFNEKKMSEFLKSRINDGVSGKDNHVLWPKAVAELEERLLARGKK